MKAALSRAVHLREYLQEGCSSYILAKILSQVKVDPGNLG